MARKPRIHYPGCVYHVMLRGNAGDTIFFSDKDRLYFYSLLNESVYRYGYRMHAFCLMNNHVHFALQVGNIPLSKIIQNIAFRYARYINKQQMRIGHLFQGRYKAILVDSNVYIKDLVRYIHLNPARAKMVSSIMDYRWSSHQAYLGYEHLPWITTNWILSFFSENKSLAIEQYQKFILADGYESLENNYISNQKRHEVFSNDNFLDQLCNVDDLRNHSLLKVQDLVKLVSDYYSINPTLLISKSGKRFYTRVRAIIAFLAKEMNISTLTEVALYFNRDVSALSHAIKKLEKTNHELIQVKIHLKNSNIQA